MGTFVVVVASLDDMQMITPKGQRRGRRGKPFEQPSDRYLETSETPVGHLRADFSRERMA